MRELLGKPVDFASDCVGADAEAKSKALANGGVLLLENVRYHPEEEANDAEFSKQLAALCDGLFVCDAFRLGASRARIGCGHHEIRAARPRPAC